MNPCASLSSSSSTPQIVSCEKHPGADALYVEQIVVGEGTPRTVVSGLVKHYTVEQMVGARVCVVANMKPSAMRGVKSEGMVLCASAADGTKCVSALSFPTL